MSKLACDIIDTPALMAVKSHLRNNLPVVIAPSTNNGLGANLVSIGSLINRKNYYFVPFKQDNPITKPRSIVFDPEYIVKTVEAALDGEQIEPILLWFFWFGTVLFAKRNRPRSEIFTSFYRYTIFSGENLWYILFLFVHN